MSSPRKLAFIGLGVMGFPIAGHLQRAGYDVTVYNRTLSRAQQWLECYGGSVATTPAHAAEGAELVFCCVGNDDDVRSVVLGDQGILSGMAPGSILIDHTTASAELARELELIAGKINIGFIDAPVSGGQVGAENGSLTVMAGGAEEIFTRALGAIECYAQCVKLLGPVGNGQLAKMVNQICIAGVVQGLAEGLYFAEQVGLPAAEVVEVISKGAAQSWQMENRYSSMLAKQYEHGFAVNWMRKDLAIVLAEAKNNDCRLELTELVDKFYAEVQGMGGGRWDTSSLLLRLQKQDN